MCPIDRASTRRQLDKRFIALQNAELFARPSRGWLKAIREALGMTTTQLAKKRLESTSHSMALEAQRVNKLDEEAQFKRMVQRLLEKTGSELWENDV